MPSLSQIYYVYEDGPYLLTETVASHHSAISTGNIAPIAMEARGGIDIGSYDDNRSSSFLSTMMLGPDTKRSR